jgi:hypothetical protein
MRATHLSDTEIQQYILQEQDCIPAVKEHIQHCENCKSRMPGVHDPIWRDCPTSQACFRFRSFCGGNEPAGKT